MKQILILFTLLFISATAYAQNPNYDADLAKKLGSDEYGMKSYVLVLLKSGSNQTSNKSFKDSCFAGHMANMQRLVQDKKLVVAGPFMKNDKELRGLFILNATLEEAETLLLTDPAIKENFLKPEIYPWYGSAALPTYLENADKIWQKKP